MIGFWTLFYKELLRFWKVAFQTVAAPVLTAMHLPTQVMDSAIRISLCPFNTEEEMRYTAEKIIERVGQLRRFTRR